MTDSKQSKLLNKSSWKVHVVATCEDCGASFEDYKNGQALAAKHAKHYGHTVSGEVGIAFKYQGVTQ